MVSSKELIRRWVERVPSTESQGTELGGEDLQQIAWAQLGFTSKTLVLEHRKQNL
jgi:hypothetical protein